MRRNKQVLIVILVVFAFIITLIPTVFILTQDQENIQIEFMPKRMKSYPYHTVWLLLDIRTKTSNIMSNLSLNININTSIEMKYEIWENSPLIKVVEVFLYPNFTHLNSVIEIEAIVYSGGISKKAITTVQVVDWILDMPPEIESMRDEFVSYLSSNHTNFKINESTIWEELGRAPQILVVEHYLFKSAYWEMELAKHATIAPHDWVKIYLRSRSSLYPNWSGKISSWSSGNHTIFEIEPPDEIFR